jgi:hypothetical protein
VTNVLLQVGGAGVTLTSGRNFAGLYQGGNLLAATADQTTNWQSAGTKVIALTTPQPVVAGLAYVGFYATGSTLPTFVGTGNIYSAINTGSAGGYRSASANSGLTPALPSTIGTQTAQTLALWAAVS